VRAAGAVSERDLSTCFELHRVLWYPWDSSKCGVSVFHGLPVRTCRITVSLSACVSTRVDPGLWPGASHGRRDDRLRGYSLVSGAGDHAELDALHPDWSVYRKVSKQVNARISNAQFKCGSHCASVPH